MTRIILFVLIILSSFSFAGDDDRIFLLTKSLEFSSSEGLSRPFTMQVKNKPTLFKVLSTSKGISKVQLFQENGKEVNKVLYISSKWFEKGTSSATVFQTDPNEIVRNAVDSNLVCEPPRDLDPADPCSVLDSGHGNPDLFMSCFEGIRQKLNLTTAGTAYHNLSRLYSLPPAEQKFMAMILTMFGEARGTTPPEENMAAVMKVIENRTRYAQERSPGSTELDVVLQSSQFSMYNPRDPNWRAAITASSEDLSNAIKVYAYRNSTYRCQQVKDNVFHYHAPGINRQGWMESRKRVSITVNGERITDHQFYAGVAWAFNSDNPYKRYAKRKGYIR